MNRILEFSPSQEEAVVSRVLMLVHQAIDQHLPSAGQANRQFTKTLYTDYPDENEKTTASGIAAADDESFVKDPPTTGVFGSYEVTSPGHLTADSVSNIDKTEAGRTVIPAPPEQRERSAYKPEAPELPPASGAPMTGLEGPLESYDGPDWVTRITLALLITGLMLLAYVLMA